MIFDIAELLPTALRLAVALLLGSAIGFERRADPSLRRFFRRAPSSRAVFL